jgi:hypothetical protein
MSSPFGPTVAYCTNCGAPVGLEHPYATCAVCGAPFAEWVVARLAAARHAATQGPDALAAMLAGPTVPQRRPPPPPPPQRTRTERAAPPPPEPKPAAPPQWEYRTLFVGTEVLSNRDETDRLPAALNAHGQEGWELVTSFSTAGVPDALSPIVLVFKRPLRPPPPRDPRDLRDPLPPRR